MTSDAALALLIGALRAAMFLAGPILAVSLLAGVVVGIAQTATQVNEASVSYVVKVAAVMALIVVLGPLLAAQMITYTRGSFESLEHVVR